MKKLLFILAILLISTMWSKGQIFNTGQTKPTVTTPLQGSDPISNYLDKTDTVLWAKLGRFGDYKLWSAKKIRYILDSLANAKQDTITLTTDGTGAATFDGQNLNIPIYSGVVSDATTTTKGIIQLAGDLSGTSASPTVVGLSLKAPLTLFDSIQTGYIPYWNEAKFKSSLLYTNGTKIGINNISLEYDFQVGSGLFSGYNTVGLNASTGIPSIYFGKLGSYIGYDYAGNERMIFNSRYVNSHYEFRINDIEKVRIQNDGSVVINVLSGTGDRNVIALSDGTLSVTATTANNLINTPQEKSGTSVSLDYSLGRNMNITLTGSTTITMSNLVAGGIAGEIHVINAASVAYPITFAGYLFEFSQAVWKSGDTVVTSGLGKPDHFTYYYNGTVVEILGQVGLKIGLRP